MMFETSVVPLLSTFQVDFLQHAIGGSLEPSDAFSADPNTLMIESGKHA